MNTIYDNTFVLGQTSATNFQAGPGISITQPSEGTVRIANDETVLWEGNCLTQGGAAVPLSESASNFEKIAIYAVPNPGGSFNHSQIFMYNGNATKGAYMCPFAESSLKGWFAYGLWEITNGTTFNLAYAAQTDNYPNLSFNNAYGGIVKVVGINRKEV